MSEQLEILKEFPIKIKIPVAWVEMDIYHHVNNANYFKYFEAARIKYFEAIKINRLYNNEGIGAVLSKASCNFIIPLVYPDNITIGARIVDIQKHYISMEQFITSPKHGLSAFGESEIVFYDFKKLKKVEIPNGIIEKIKKIENKTF